MRTKKPNRTSIGGQAVMEGVMMRGNSSMATSVRDNDGIIRTETVRLKPLKEKSFIFRMPIIRGIINFFSSMVIGTKTLMRSAEVLGEEEQPSKFEQWLSKKFKVDIFSVIMYVAVIIAIALSVGLFVVLPQIATNGLNSFIKVDNKSIWFNLLEGGIRMLIFIAYLLLTSLLKDIKRTYMYHGAEHKTISAYENGWELTVENVRKASRVHDRCGTTFMFLVMAVSILVFSVANSLIGAEGIVRVLIKIALLPLVAGISYEILKGLAKTDFFLFYIFKIPGLLLQRITTKEPTDDMIEVAIKSFKTVLEMDADPTIAAKEFVFPKSSAKKKQEILEKFKEAGIDAESDAEWIIACVAKIKRSEVETSIMLKPEQIEEIDKIVDNRLIGRPLWYILGDTEFYGYTIKVDESVLIPRPETEELVAEGLKLINSESKVLDMCTGSGVIAIAIAKEAGITVDAVDVSTKALEKAKENAELNGANVNFIESNLFEKVEGKYDLIISNPPYIKTADIENLSKEVKFEPILALDGGEDGLDFYREISKRAKEFLNEGGTLLMECGYDQKQAILDLLAGFSSVTCIKDLEGKDRIIKAVL